MRRVTTTPTNPEDTLKTVFGHTSFRPGQKEAVNAAMDGRNVFLTAPTGSGKSLCYQLPAALQPQGETTLVISPLIALMRDQIGALTKRGVPCTDLHSERSDHESLLAAIAQRKFRMVYTSPEQTQKEEVRDAIRRGNVKRMVVDEAHCLSQWGHDFRPAYAKLGAVAEMCGIAKVSAFTATASTAVKDDIRKSLKLKKAYEQHEEPERPNLTYGVTHVEQRMEKKEAIREMIERYASGSHDGAIVYCGTRDATIEMSGYLNRRGISAGFYHGEIGVRARKQAEQGFLEDNPRVLAATNAFGMGVDKPNIRLIVHEQVPATIQHYLQETGRAGRDGKPAHCHLLYHPDDMRLQEYFLEKNCPETLLPFGVFRVLKELKGMSHFQQNGFFHVDMFKFFRRFDVKDAKRHYEVIDRTIEVNACLDILEHCGAIERDGSFFRLVEDPDTKPALTTLVRKVTTTRREVKTALLKDMTDYLHQKRPTQDYLIKHMG